jgi:hypothetical protein
MTGVVALLAPRDEEEGEESDEEDEEEDGSGSEASDDDEDDDDAAANLENETEEEFLERYASIARDMANGGGSDGDEDDDDDDGEGLAEEDEAFDAALEPRHGDGAVAAEAFCAWYNGWRSGSRDDRMRVSTMVDAAVLKKFAKSCPGFAA